MNYHNDDVYNFVRSMPKVELHAHLNGSLSNRTLKKLVSLKLEMNPDINKEDLSIPCLNPGSDLSQCFEVFSFISKVVDNPQAVFMAAVDTIEDFYNDGVRYLELRTTPKENGHDLTQETYIQSVLKAITHATKTTCKGMIVKLLLSIDRRRSLNDAETTLKVAQVLIGECSNIIGIDLSGDPSQGDIKNFLPILEQAKQLGLKLAVHVAEVPDQHEEVELLLKMQPDRLGHGTFLHPEKNGSSTNFELLKQLQIPLEICLTSNVLCKTVPSYEDHHFKLFRRINYPCTLCTDDKGVFNTSLSDEYYLASQHYSLSKEELFELSYESISFSFCTEQEKSLLRKHWEEFKKKTESI